jgi:hypothetical protein
MPAVAAGARAVEAIIARGEPVYGVNTGFGKLASTRIEANQLATLQLNLIRSHSVGVGEPLQPAVVRLMLALKAASLARGHSGVREEVVETLIAAHKTARRARLIEIDPLYADRIVRRWVDYAKDDAILESTQQVFSEMSRERLNQRDFNEPTELE